MKGYFTMHQIERCEEAQRNWGVKFRESAHSFTGYVLDLWFPSETDAFAMARKWSQEVGQSIKVRKDMGGLLKVSVPVQCPSY
jgi:hypothetical protein